MNDFKKDLEWSFDQRDNEIFESLYRRIWNNIREIVTVTDLKTQKQGVDKIIILTSGREIKIDEKKRRQNYGDILIEEYSDFDRKKKGWLSDEKHTDYIVYAIMDICKAYLFPTDLLRLVARKNYQAWLKKYGRQFAKNKNYRTSFISVPTGVLLDLIKKEMTQDI